MLHKPKAGIYLNHNTIIMYGDDESSGRGSDGQIGMTRISGVGERLSQSAVECSTELKLV